MEIYALPDKVFKIIIINKLYALEKNTKMQLNKIGEKLLEQNENINKKKHKREPQNIVDFKNAIMQFLKNLL